jgi:hypothetical protein
MEPSSPPAKRAFHLLPPAGILIVRGNRHQTDLLNFVAEWISILLKRNTAVLANRIARERTTRLGLAKTARTHDGRLAYRVDQG